MPSTFVLVPGAWHGGWAWRPVAERLRAAGHRTFTPTLPGLADGDDPSGWHLSDAVDFLVDLIEGSDLTDVALVGHSWGGYPMTGAASRLGGRVGRVVYWNAFVPAEGACLLDEIPPEYVDLFTGLAASSDNDSISLPFDVWQSAFMNDAHEDAQRVIHALMVPQPMSYFRETVTPLRAGIACSYLLSADDTSLPAGEWAWVPRFPQRLGVEPAMVPGSHESCFSRPEELADALLETIHAM
jgi:pimeloyl-ACP methyl ester carboxylesterase